MNRSKLPVALLIFSMLAAGCSATTNFDAAQQDTQLRVKNSSDTAVPRADKFSTTSFGNYDFEATLNGHPPMYGILPLKFNGGYLAMDILLFAPATFFNLREVFPYYQFDVASGVIRYKKNESDPWTTFTPHRMRPNARKPTSPRRSRIAGLGGSGVTWVSDLIADSGLRTPKVVAGTGSTARCITEELTSY